MRPRDLTFKTLEPILANSQFAITITDNDGKLTVFNEAAEALTGYSRDEALGQSIKHFYKNEAECLEIATKVRTEGKVEAHETQLVRKNGEIVPISILLAQLHDETGQVVGTLGISVSLKERTRLASDLEREKLRVGFYNDVLCHDIRNATQTISGYLQMMERGTLGELPPGMKKAVDVCLRQSRRIRDLIENVNLLDKLESNGLDPKGQTNLKELVAEVADLVRDAYTDRRVNIEITLPDGDRWVAGCPLLREALFNVIDNAAAHNGKAAPWIDARLEDTPEGDLRVVVEDNGPGITQGHQKEIFQRYVRLSVGGSGLGLAVVKAVVDRSGGRVWAEDRVEGDPDQGARFVIELPKADVPGEEADAPSRGTP